ncbi:VOC family protein [Sorangium sp. So ce131]|uniref:VOC family protein n=1 Tax=Sorangium sp. So ce131 TaxID=3133282 RepID=UPI003F643DDF
MKILDVITPIVAEDHDATVAHYREVLGLSVKRVFDHAGFHLTWLGPIVVLSAPDEAALAVPRQVAGIFVVDDLDAFWERLSPRTTVLSPRTEVPSGRAFVVRHPGGRAFEYLQLKR